MDFVRCLARPAALIDRHPRLPLFFSCFSDVGVHSSIALATRLSGLQEMYLQQKKRSEFNDYLYPTKCSTVAQGRCGDWGVLTLDVE